MRWSQAWHREQREAVLAGPYAATKPAQLVGFIGAIDWGSIDYQTRLTVLHEVNEAITKFRESQKLDPIDDPLPGAPPNAFQVIRKILTQFPASRGGPPERSGKQ